MRFAIRDDDTSYFTRPEKLDRLYRRVLPQAPVSLAVIPNALESFHLGDARRFYHGTEQREVGENPELIQWLRERLATGEISVLCHGYTHEYRRIGTRLVQEYAWKPYGRLVEETARAKQQLESALGVEVDTFVPPGNKISRVGLEALRPYFRNALAAVPLRRWWDLRPDWDSIASYARRLHFQLHYGIPNPKPERVAGVRLLPSFSMTRHTRWETISARFESCRRIEADFIVAVHYWELDGRLESLLMRLIDQAADAGCEFAHCRQLFDPAGGTAAATQEESQWAASRIS